MSFRVASFRRERSFQPGDVVVVLTPSGQPLMDGKVTALFLVGERRFHPMRELGMFLLWGGRGEYYEYEENMRHVDEVEDT